MFLSVIMINLDEIYQNRRYKYNLVLIGLVVFFLILKLHVLICFHIFRFYLCVVELEIEPG